MARIFLDANILVDILENRKNTSGIKLDEQETYISALTVHIAFYVTKKKIPSRFVTEILNDINLIDFTNEITQKALQGPTPDFEDNVQLHSAADLECDVFLTSDQELLKMRFFGKTKICDAI